jgi:flagellar secretion chaperone FliS
MNPYLKQYQQTQVQTSSPEMLLIMLYDGAIQFLNKAKVGIENKDIEEIHNNILGAQRILTEFMSTLDMKIGGEVAQNLYNLYDYLHYRLVLANLKKDVSMVDEVLVHLKDLKQTWEEAIKIAAKERVNRETVLSSQEIEDNDSEDEDFEEDELEETDDDE